MDSDAQKQGEARVKKRLIDPLIRQGLQRPGGMTVSVFQDMQRELCQKLAYMSELGLDALAEIGAGMAGGSGKDRFPIARALLEQAGRIEPPPDDGSPRIRAVFQHAVGRAAVAGGYAPELLRELKKVSTFANDYMVTMARERAAVNRGRLDQIKRQRAAGGTVSDEDLAFEAARAKADALCKQLSEISVGGVS